MLVFWAFQLAAAANSPSLCSGKLTAQGGSQFDTYNSYGSCTSHCSGYAYAIAQGNECWCSNEAPGETVSVSECNQACPGYPADTCGGSGVYAYFQIGQPSGTASASSASASSASSASASSASSASTSTTSSSSTSSDSSTSDSTSSASTTSSDSSTSDSSTSTSSPPSSTKTTSEGPSVITITQSNSVQTQTITQSVSQSSGQESSSASIPPSSSNRHGFWQNKGAVAGVFTVVGLVALALAILLLYFCIRRRRNDQTISAASTHKSPSGRDSFAQLENDSQLVPIFDQRVDAQQMYMRWENNVSQQSLQDNQDYSRKVLRVANPDGED